MAEVRALYSRYNAYVCGGFAAVVGVAAIAAVLTAFRPDVSNAGARAGAGLVGAAVCAVLVRLSRVRVILRPDRLELVNPLRTHRIPWAAVDAVDTFVMKGWKVRVRSGGASLVAFGLSQNSRYVNGQDPEYDSFERHAPVWVRDGHAELVRYWQDRTVRR